VSIGARDPSQIGKKAGPYADAKRKADIIGERKKGTEDKIRELEQLKKDLNTRKTEIEAGAKPKAKPKAEPKATATKSMYRRFMDSPLANTILGPELARRHAKFICSIVADEIILVFMVTGIFGGYAAWRGIKFSYKKAREEIRLLRIARAAKTKIPVYDYLTTLGFAIGMPLGCAQGATIDIATETQEVIELTSLRDSLLTIDETTKVAALEAGVSTDKISAAMLSTPSDMNIWTQLAIEAFVPFYNAKFGGFARTMSDEMIDAPIAAVRRATAAGLLKVLPPEKLYGMQTWFRPETPVIKTIAIYKEWLSKNGIKDTIEQEKFITCYLINVISTGFKNMTSASLDELFEKDPWLKEWAEQTKKLTDLYNKYEEWFKDNKDKFADAKNKAEAFKKWFKETIIDAILPDEFIELSEVNCQSIRQKYSTQMKNFENLVNIGARRAQLRRQREEEEKAKKKPRKSNRTKPQKKAAGEDEMQVPGDTSGEPKMDIPK